MGCQATCIDTSAGVNWADSLSSSYVWYPGIPFLLGEKSLAATWEIRLWNHGWPLAYNVSMCRPIYRQDVILARSNSGFPYTNTYETHPHSHMKRSHTFILLKLTNIGLHTFARHTCNVVYVGNLLASASQSCATTPPCGDYLNFSEVERGETIGWDSHSI